MSLFSKKKINKEDNELEVEKEIVEEKKVRRERKPIEREFSKPQDPTRLLPLIFLVIFLFISYLSWIAYQR